MGSNGVWRWIVLSCLIAAVPQHIRAQSAGAVQPASKQQAPPEPALDMNSDLPATEITPSPESQPAAPGPSSSVNPDLPDAPTPLASNSYVPLTSDERLHYFWKDTLLSPLSYVGALGSAFGQRLAGQPHQWSSGYSGYARRVGVNVLQFGAQETIHQGGAALLHTDPRYLPCQCRGGFHRTWYAMEMSFLTYKSDRSKTFDFSQLAGAYGGAMIAALPYPSHYSPLVQGVQNGHIQVGANVVVNIFKEFSPELSRLNPIRRRDTQ